VRNELQEQLVLIIVLTTARCNDCGLSFPISDVYTIQLANKMHITIFWNATK